MNKKLKKRSAKKAKKPVKVDGQIILGKIKIDSKTKKVSGGVIVGCTVCQG